MRKEHKSYPSEKMVRLQIALQTCDCNSKSNTAATNNSLEQVAAVLVWKVICRTTLSETILPKYWMQNVMGHPINTHGGSHTNFIHEVGVQFGKLKTCTSINLNHQRAHLARIKRVVYGNQDEPLKSYIPVL
ncbi:MAG: hypothetical protein KF880_00035 [Ferruginibacter sp.]|nr:hypothetical protein [Ferruginibacter sp.]